jgi:hypothetical protein
MALLFFDVVSLARDGIHVAANANVKTTFEQLGLASGEPLLLHAREITLLGAPDDRPLQLVTDRLVCSNAAALTFANPGVRSTPAASVDIWAQRIDGQLRVTTHGRKGAIGAKGSKGTPAEFTTVRVVIPGDPGDDGGPFTKPTVVFEKRLTKAAGNGGQGKQGAQGETGPPISINFVSATTTPMATSIGGDGGDGGPGGDAGDGGDEFPDGAPGTQGGAGGSGPAGPVSVRPRSSADTLWAAYLSLQRDTVVAWCRHQLAVAEYHYRLGTSEGIETARGLLGIVAARPQPYGSQEQIRARTLLQQLFEHTTFLGLPRDLDVVPDVVFAAADNDDLLDAARDILTDAAVLAGQQAVEGHFATTMTLAATQASNALAGADARIEEAGAHLDIAISSTDLARGRAANLKTTIDELQRAIEKEAADPSSITTAFKIAGIGMAMIGVVAGIATGAGAVVAVGAGVATVKGIADQADDMFDMVRDIKEKLDDPEVKEFVNGIDDLGKAGKSLLNIGKIIDDLKSLQAKHPAEKIREMARLQREHLLLLTEIGLHQQMEKEAQLGKTAAIRERDALVANANDANKLATLITQGAAAHDPVLRRLLDSARLLLDTLAVRMFRTVRAKEIYLARDPLAVVRHDAGHLHPDLPRVLSPAEQVTRVRDQVLTFTPEVIEWSSITGDFAQTGTLSQTPAPFFFTTSDPEHLASLKSDEPEIAFEVSIDDITELNGSQIFEARFDRFEVAFHGARLDDGSTPDAVLLKNFGHWSMRRRPTTDKPDGDVKTFALPDLDLQLTARQDGNIVTATFEESVNADAVPPETIWGRGIAGNWRLINDGGIDFTEVTKVDVGFISRALSGSRSASTREGALLLKPLAGWPPAPTEPRPPTPIPPRGARGVSAYPGSVAAVGAGLI